MNVRIDIRDILPAIRVPTLVLQRSRDRLVHSGHGRYLAERIAGARLVELDGDDHVWFWGNAEPILAEVEEFVTGVRPAPSSDRFLTTILFTDIVRSTDLAAELGDRRWRELLRAHHDRIRDELARHGGTEIDMAGDGVFATFDGPARAVHCAAAVLTRVRELGLDVRAGVHTGECERLGDKVTGIAVHSCARISALAAEGEILVSSTVKDLVAGSGLRFEERGEHVLKGVPDKWRLYAVV